LGFLGVLEIINMPTYECISRSGVAIRSTHEPTIRELSRKQVYLVGQGNFSEGPSNYWVVGEGPSNVTPLKDVKESPVPAIPLDRILEA
jgi:hypothetical protein